MLLQEVQDQLSGGLADLRGPVEAQDLQDADPTPADETLGLVEVLLGFGLVIRLGSEGWAG